MKKLTLIAMTMLLAVAGCKNNAEAESPKVEPVVQGDVKAATGSVVEITSEAQFREIIAQKNRLMVFDLYADWCGPCKMLAPILKEVAQSHGTDADVYKINTEKLPQIASAFQVQGIPHVVYFKDGGIVNALTGLYPKEAYEQGIEVLSQNIEDTASGTIKNGVRHIALDGAKSKGNIFTYRGDKVELTFKAKGTPFTASIEQLKVTGSSDGKSDLKLSFETKELGFMPLEISSSDGRKDRLWVGVIQYGQKKSGYRETDAKEFSEAIKGSNTILLDVRTSGEFAEGHIKGAKLIPVQELESRLNELAGAKDKTVLVYCRSGNRSTVAAKILQENGFGSVVNLRPGIGGWTKAGLPVEQ